MQKPNPRKRAEIMSAAARLFASRPFHDVTLDAVAAEARVGKGTIYVYFASKESLYLGLIRDGVDRMLAHIRDLTAKAPPTASSLDLIARIVAELVAFAFRFPEVFRLIRAGLPQAEDRALRAKRRTLARLVESLIRRGRGRGEFADPRPELTTQFLLHSIQAARMYGPRDVTPRALTAHIVRVFGHGLRPGGSQRRQR